jgi:16S rRNA (guanine(966)-N(2))-methyltransferase RsmD
MRITGGLYRGRKIVCPPGEIRPAMDRMRESLFSILYDIEDLSFLDLFSGSGLVGIEAASRKSTPVHLVELDRNKKSTIEKNISFVESDIKLFITDVFIEHVLIISVALLFAALFGVLFIKESPIIITEEERLKSAIEQESIRVK